MVSFMRMLFAELKLSRNPDDSNHSKGGVVLFLQIA